MNNYYCSMFNHLDKLSTYGLIRFVNFSSGIGIESVENGLIISSESDGNIKELLGHRKGEAYL